MVKAAMKLPADKRTILVVVIGLLFILSLNFFQKEVRGFFYYFSGPLQKAFWRAGDTSSDFFESIFNSKNLKKENEELNLRVQELFLLKNSINELGKENKTLREALGLGLENEFRLELAEIIGKGANKDAILIDKGLKDGISKGLLVITSQKVLVGKTAEVYQNYSRVLLISDKESSFEARTSGSNISGLLKGLGSFKVMIDIIPLEEKIKEGDLVVSGDFLIGLVREVKRIDANVFQQAEVSPFFNMRDFNKVFIILNF